MTMFSAKMADPMEERLIKAEREKATAIRAIIRQIMERYPATRTDKWLLLFHFADYCNVRISWTTLDGLRSLPNPDQLMRRRREVVAECYPELRDMQDKRLQRVWRKAFYRPASELKGF